MGRRKALTTGRRMLLAQRRSKPLGNPPTVLNAAECAAWRQIASNANPSLHHDDRGLLAIAAVQLTMWRCGIRVLPMLRQLVRWLATLFIDRDARRRLLHPIKGNPCDALEMSDHLPRL